MKYTSGLAKDYNSDGSGVIYLGKKAADIGFVRDAIEEIAQETEIVTDGSDVTRKVKPYIKDMIKLLNWKDAMEEGILVDYGKVKLKELKGDPYVAKNDKKLNVLGRYDLPDKQTYLNPDIFVFPEDDIKGVPLHELTHQGQHIKRKIERLTRKYGEDGVTELEREAYRSRLLVPFLSRPEDAGRLASLN